MSASPRPTRLAPADSETLRAAAEVLRGGGLVAMPTETVYGLAGDATNDRAVAAIYAAKGRPDFNPLIAHFAEAQSAAREAEFDSFAEKLAAAFWPGPLTIVAPVAKACRVSLLARAGLDTLGLRVPAHPIARALIAAAKVPLAAPSANRSGRLSPTTAAHVLADLDGRIDWILDGGSTPLGVESTIVACLGGPPRLLRPGALARERIEAELGVALARQSEAGAPLAPGMLASHYAPRARLRLEAHDVGRNEAALDFAGALGVSTSRLDLSPDGDLDEAAANLFAYLRALDAGGAARIAVAPIPERGLGVAINDRLRRAAAPRPEA
ncbi:MAG: threonylcarbamoyl-AMP synthase [Bradyrhizobium sp.]|nr:MAG: threonylcarbamoyl-AMP synthase [Bradyrhizobium sp.]